MLIPGKLPLIILLVEMNLVGLLEYMRDPARLINNS